MFGHNYLQMAGQEDENAEGGHRKAMDRLPSNPEVENIVLSRMVM